MSQPTDNNSTSRTGTLPHYDEEEWEIVQPRHALSITYPDKDGRKHKLQYLMTRLQMVNLADSLDYDHHTMDLGSLILLTSEMRLEIAKIHGINEKEVWAAGVEHMWRLWKELKEPDMLQDLKVRFGK